jgi:hypothetical protein
MAHSFSSMCARVLAIASLVAISTGAVRSAKPNVVTVVATDCAFDMGGPNASMPGENTNATLVLEPGSYPRYCEMPAPDPARHYAKGMAKGFVVTP